MVERIVSWLQGIPDPLVLVIIAALPVVELRLSIPYGILSMHMPVVWVFILSVLGNVLPILPILYFMEPVSARLRKFRLWARFFDWLFERTRRKASDVIEKYELWGLMIFVAIPLPMTGAWTGAMAASLFNLDKKRSFWAVSAGVLIAAIIVTILSLGTKGVMQHVP